MTARALALCLIVAACGGTAKEPTPMANDPSTTPTEPAASEPERRGTIRADTTIWLELDGARLVVDDGDGAPWKDFADREVIVTGEAVGADRFRIDTLRVAERKGGLGPYFAVGAAQVLDGELTTTTVPAGARFAGEMRTELVVGGTRYAVAGPYIVGLNPGRLRLRVRVLEPDMSYVARSADRDIWVLGLADP